MPARPLSARAAYRRWYAAAGPWAGFFRAVPLIAAARGVAPAEPDGFVPPAEPIAGELAAAGAAEGWLGRPDVLLLLDLPGATSVAVAAALAPAGVRPVVVVFQWPEPGALVPSRALTAALLAHAPTMPRRTAPAQYAFVLARERARAATPAELATRFDNRYELGAVDLPSPERLRAGEVAGVVACRLDDCPPAPDLTDYLAQLERATMPVRRLVLRAPRGPDPAP